MLKICFFKQSLEAGHLFTFAVIYYYRPTIRSWSRFSLVGLFTLKYKHWKISSVTLKGTWFDIFSNCEVSVKIHLKVIFQVNPQLAFLFQRLKNSNLSKTTTNKYVILSNIEKWKNYCVILTMNYSVTISRIIRHVPCLK